jgi:uracil-DNA glycosylase family 4
MFLTMDPSHYIDWDSYENWAEYNADKGRQFKESWPGGTALSKILSGIPGTTLDDIWLGDAVKCPVNNNRAGDVNSHEVFAHCSSYLKREIRAVNPRVIITMGNDPAEQLLNGIFEVDTESISAGTKDCGRIFQTSPPVIISPHWANGWLGRNNNRTKVREAILEMRD